MALITSRMLALRGRPPGLVGGINASMSAIGQSAPEHRIGVRVVNGIGEFYDRVTGQKFVPRGNNYIRLGPQTDLSGRRVVYHSTFDPGSYNPSRAEAALERMHVDGYN